MALLTNEKPANASYSNLGDSFQVNFKLDMLSKQDQSSLLLTLLRESGIEDAMYDHKSKTRQETVDAINEAFKAWQQAK